MAKITYLSGTIKTMEVDCKELINDCLDYMQRHNIPVIPENIHEELYENLDEYLDNRGYYDKDENLEDDYSRTDFNASIQSEIDDLLEEMFDEE